MSAFETGPHLNGAFFCEKVLTEADGANTYVRVVDRIARHVVSPERPTVFPAHVAKLTLVLLFRAGETRGPFAVALRITRPSGRNEIAHEFTINFPGTGAAGVNYHMQLVLEMDETGPWWIDVLGGDQRRLMTRVPLELQDQWTKGPATPGPSPSL
jgi:hypothetical protein